MSPRTFDPLSEHVVGVPNNVFTLRTGREIYNEQSISGLNRLPISTLISFIVGGSEFEGAPLDIEELAERLLVDGSIAILSGEFLSDLLDVTPTRVVQELPDSISPIDKDEMVTRVYSRASDTDQIWTVIDYQKYGTADQEAVSEPFTIPAGEFYVYPNGFGIIYPVQTMYWRIEEIYITMRKLTSGANVTTHLVEGLLSDVKKTQNAMDGENRLVGVPTGTKAHDVTSKTITDQLLEQLKDLVPNYLRNLNVIDTADASTISGVSRRILMTPMIVFVEKVRGWIIQICKEFGYEVIFESLPVDSIEDRSAEFVFMQELRNAGVITPEDFTAKARKLSA